MFRLCWAHRITRWDEFIRDTPAYVFDAWEVWMATNPDHPAHRDQLALDIGTLQAAAAGASFEEGDSQKLFRARLRDPRLSDDE